MLKGHFAYFGIGGNYQRLTAVVYQTRRLWRQWLSRLLWKSRIAWEQFSQLQDRYQLPGREVLTYSEQYALESSVHHRNS